MAPVADFTGSFVGGMLFSLIAGDGLKLRLSGVLGSIRWCSHRRRHLARHGRREAKSRLRRQPRPARAAVAPINTASVDTSPSVERFS